MTSLRQRMLHDLQIRNYSPRTTTTYVRAVACFAKHFGTSPQLLGAKEIRDYQVFILRSATRTPYTEELSRSIRQLPSGIDRRIDAEKV